MNTTLNRYFENAKLAFATYETLARNGDVISLSDDLKDKDFTVSLANQFAQKYVVLDQQVNTGYETLTRNGDVISLSNDPSGAGENEHRSPSHMFTV